MMSILIVGFGSVGKRHARNLHILGCRISCVDPREDRREELHSFSNIGKSYRDMGEALQDELEFDGVVVCSPTKYHVYQAQAALEYRIPVLLEKPLAKKLVEAEVLYQRHLDAGHQNPMLLLGYTWRWWPAFQFVRDMVHQGWIGTPHYLNITVSAHLADWHPWESYHDFFMSSGELGGGALLDESHWIDQMIWIFGPPESIFASVDLISNLEITSDDSVELLAKYRNGMKAVLHMDIYGRPHEKSLKIIGSKGVLTWNEDSNCVSISQSNGETSKKNFPEERNYMFQAVAKEFLELIRGSNKLITCGIQDGILVQKAIEAVRQSNASGRLIRLDGVS